MNWDQIEHKWAAMTRRIRADWKGSPDGQTTHPGASVIAAKAKLGSPSPVEKRTPKVKDGSPPVSR